MGEALNQASPDKRQPAGLPLAAEARFCQDRKLSDAEKRAKVAEIKVAKVLRGLAGKLDKEGNYSSGKVIVKEGETQVAVYLFKLDEAALAELKRLGFEKMLEAKAVKMVLGTVAVKKLQEIAYLDAVRWIDLPSFAK